MKRPAVWFSGLLVLAATTACVPTWKNAGGTVAMSPAYLHPNGDTEDAASVPASGRVTFTVPDGWHWVRRGEDFIATRDGVLVRHPERLCSRQRGRSDDFERMKARFLQQL